MAKKVEIIDSKLIPKDYTDSLPPIFGADFRAGNITWKRLDSVVFDEIGKILVCHLLVENYLDKQIELKLPKDLNISKAKLSFNQKISLIANDPIMVEQNFGEPVRALNKIRNAFAHDIESRLSETDIEVFLKFLKFYKRKNNPKMKIPPLVNGHEVEIIQIFTQTLCAFFAGACTAYTGHFNLYSLSNANTDSQISHHAKEYSEHGQ